MTMTCTKTYKLWILSIWNGYIVNISFIMLQNIRSEGHYRQSVQNYFNPLIDKLFNCNVYTLKVFLASRGFDLQLHVWWNEDERFSNHVDWCYMFETWNVTCTKTAIVNNFISLTSIIQNIWFLVRMLSIVWSKQQHSLFYCASDTFCYYIMTKYTKLMKCHMDAHSHSRLAHHLGEDAILYCI